MPKSGQFFEELNDWLAYDQETGQITWRKRIQAHKGWKHPGDQCGGIQSNGYRQIIFRRSSYLAHRLAWFLYYRQHPPGCIDHINGDRDDNRIINLRPATRSQNCMNSTVRKTSKSGVKGVTWCSKRGQWRATLEKNGLVLLSARYDKLDDAVAARRAAECLHFGVYNFNR